MSLQLWNEHVEQDPGDNEDRMVMMPVTLHSLPSMALLRRSPSYARAKVPINGTLPEERIGES